MAYKGFKTLKEAIGKGNVDKAITNICNILSRRIGKSIKVSQYTFDYTNSNGDFSGVRCMIGRNQAMRFNWKLNGNSANVESISFWLNLNNPEPTLEMEVGKLSLIKVIDVIEDVLQNKKAGTYSVLEEGFIRENIEIISKTRGKVSQEIATTLSAWASDEYKKSSEFIKVLSNKRMNDIFTDFMNWYNNLAEVEVQRYNFVNKSTFLNYLSKYMDENGIENKFARKVSVNKASKEMMKAEKSSEQNFRDMLNNLTAEDKFKMLRSAVKSVVRGTRVGFMVVGKAGVGKTTQVVDALDEAGASYVPISGAVKNARALFEILAKHNKKGRIILFDDSDSMLRNKECVNILKTATDSGDAYGGKRIISYVDTKHTVDATKHKAQIVFESGIVLIANMKKSDLDRNEDLKAIASRLSPLEITMDKEEMLDFIKSNLNNILPDIPMKAKTEVWDYINEVIGSITQIDFRRFQSAVAWRVDGEEGDDLWKKIVYSELR